MSLFHIRPRVSLIAKTNIEKSEVGEFLKEHGMGWPANSDDPSVELVSEFGGRICYMSFGKGRPSKEYHEHILEVGHGSVLEHGVWNFAIWGVSRALTHELIRHRAGSAVSQLSQRYVDESLAEYVIAPLFQHESVIEEYQEDLLKVHELYLKWQNKAVSLIDKHHPHLQGTDKRKNARQAARYFLPNATETKLLFSVNTRALRHIIELRGSEHADVEIRNLAIELYNIAVKKAPNLFFDYELINLPDGSKAVRTKFNKV